MIVNEFIRELGSFFVIEFRGVIVSSRLPTDDGVGVGFCSGFGLFLLAVAHGVAFAVGGAFVLVAARAANASLVMLVLAVGGA